MFSPPSVSLAGTKRPAHNIDHSHLPEGPDQEYRSNHIDPRVLCCDHCPDPCPDLCHARPSKRRASPSKVAEHAHLGPDLNIDPCNFPDDCFEKFCQDCTVDASCPPDCALPCADDGCPDEEACFDPHCGQKDQECADGCSDPECKKLTVPSEPCFEPQCAVQPCVMGDPSNDCHMAHSAPMADDTIHCYSMESCHFQDGQHGHDYGLSSFETYPCYLTNHNYHSHSTSVSNAPTPALSHGNFTSLASVYASEPSLSSVQTVPQGCFLNITADHCHIDNSCCHGSQRACGDCPSTSPHVLHQWNSSMEQGNGLASHFMNFGFDASQPASPTSISRNSISSTPYMLDSAVMGLHDHPWMLSDSALSTQFAPNAMGSNKLDFLASAVQLDLARPDGTLADASTLLSPGSTDSSNCICKWQHAPGILCLASFHSAEALHKHIKSAHVDNCTQCTCHWENCDAATKDFKQRSKLSRHLLGHAGYRPYACSYAGCDKTFATNQAKDNHERTHTGERPYVCDRCGYTTTTHTQLQTHISALHEGKKPHKCRYCDFTCADSSNLSKHERTHQTLRPYRCPHTACTFKPDCRWENLKRHLRRSGHCPELLIESSDEYKNYRDSVRREIEEWHRRHSATESGVVTGRRKIKVEPS